ncbi:unnamed protein product [Adineta ricciae]|uniref:Uncharacterized protein n=1 Tax=Adineta ricciae TaxID=249248 RepID=A0A815TMP5_ADIRI|nr:unnamed protein product [Adineta ricciae]
MNFVYFLVIIYLNTIYCLPQVRVRPNSAVLPSSSEARLICESTDTPFMSVAYWTYIGQRIELNPSIIEMHGNELRLFQFGDTAYTQPGAYSCVVSTRYGLLESEPAMLSLPMLDSFPPSKNDNKILNLTEGNTAVISCELPNGNPKPIPLFSLDNNPIVIEPNSNRYKILPSGNLHIIDAQLSDAGKYQCAAKNVLTGQIVNNSQTTTLQISPRPWNEKEYQSLFTVQKPPPASRVLVGDNFSIECVIAGWPIPVVEWEKYGDVLPEKRSEVTSGTLYLYNIRLEDRGTYICRASSSNGQSDIAYTALVEVLEPPKVIQRPDSLIQVNDGDSVSIKCGFRGRPEPSVSWLYNGEEFSINGSPVTGGVLSLNQPKEGIYQCVGRNAYGIAHASTAVVLPDDSSKNEMDIPPAKKSLIIFGPNNITVYEGETVQLHCLTQPGSTVQWLHNNEIINLNQMRRFEMLASGGLRIVSAQRSDSGIYECIASKIGYDTSAAKCFVYVNGLGLNIPVSKLEIIDMKQIDNNAVRLSWKINETIENYISSIQVQYRFIHPKTSWMATDDFYNRSTNYAVVQNLQPSQTFKFRLVGFDMNGKQLVISAAKRIALVTMKNSINSIVPEITEAWITNDGQIGLKWKLLHSTGSEMIDGFVIYYRSTRSKVNFTTISVPNMRFPPINTFTISTLQADQEYELRMSTYSSRGASSMSNSIKISVPAEHRSRNNQMNSFTNFDEILDNITKIQHPSSIRHHIIASSAPSTQKSSDMLYLTIGIISGVLLILIIILIAMCVLRLIQRKKLIAHVKSANGSAYYCDGLHKPLNPDYATTPCLQHGVVSVDGKLVPFTYPTNPRSPKLYYHRIPANSTINENGTLRLNSNPMNRLDNDNTQENFYHTLTPLNAHGHYEDCQSHTCSRNHSTIYERSSNSSCPMHHHHHLGNYSSDTLPLKMSSNMESSSQMDEAPFSPTHYHHGTCQRQRKCKGNIASLANRGLIVDQSAPPSSTGSSNSSSGISSSMESPYNHWKYLVPLSVSTTTTTTTAMNNNNQHVSSPIIEPIPLTSA